MKRKHVLSAMFLFTIFLVADLNIFVEAHLEHKPEYLEEPEINVEQENNIERIIVDKKGGSADYTSIQTAIEQVQPGGTIYVKIGSYNEILDIRKQVRLVGEDKDNTLINPVSDKNSYAIQIATNGVELSGFGITNQGSGLYATGIKITAAETIIKDCNIVNTPVGIAIWSSENRIIDCDFWGCSDEGIAFLGSSYTECNDNLVKGCRFYNNCDGIELQYSSNNLISDCLFYNNTHAGIDAIGSNNNDNTIQNCEIYNNLGFGIYFSNSSRNEILKCSFSNNKIMTIDSQDNILTECRLDTIYLLDESSIIIENCENLDESNIKAIRSQYDIKKEVLVEDNILELQNEENHKYRIITTILNVLNNLKSRFRNSLRNYF